MSSTPQTVISSVDVKRVDASSIVPEIGWNVSGVLSTTVATLTFTAPTYGTSLYCILEMSCWYDHTPTTPSNESSASLTATATTNGVQSWLIPPRLGGEANLLNDIDFRLCFRINHTAGAVTNVPIAIQISNNGSTNFYPSVWFFHYHIII